MERNRLTEKQGACNCIKGLDVTNLHKCSNQALICKTTDKLSAYEDTGLTPERVAELAAAERDGRLLELPCKVGDKIYRVGCERTYEFTVVRIDTGENILRLGNPGTEDYTSCFLDEIGGRYFLTPASSAAS